MATWDWDPLSVQEGADSSQSGPSATAKLDQKTLDVVLEQFYKQTMKDAVWNAAPRPEPDLSWYSPSCSAEDWKHQVVKLQLGQGIAYVSFNRPEANNAINENLMIAMYDVVFALHARKDIRVVVFSGEGSFFCSGEAPGGVGKLPLKPADAGVQKSLKDFGEEGLSRGAFPDGNIAYDRLQQCKFWHTMTLLPQFTIALVNGSTMGTGLGFIACCDMAISLSTAYFQMADVRQGMTPAIIAPYIVAKVGTGNAKRMLCTAQNFTAQEAKRFGLIQEVFESLAKAHDFIKDICASCTLCGPRSAEAAKKLVLGVGGQPITEPLMFYTSAMLAMVTVSDEARDGMIALQAKQPKPWEAVPIKPLY